jgi:hypothetical protein
MSALEIELDEQFDGPDTKIIRGAARKELAQLFRDLSAARTCAELAETDAELAEAEVVNLREALKNMLALFRSYAGDRVANTSGQVAAAEATLLALTK